MKGAKRRQVRRDLRRDLFNAIAGVCILFHFPKRGAGAAPPTGAALGQRWGPMRPLRGPQRRKRFATLRPPPGGVGKSHRRGGPEGAPREELRAAPPFTLDNDTFCRESFERAREKNKGPLIAIPPLCAPSWDSRGGGACSGYV